MASKDRKSIALSVLERNNSRTSIASSTKAVRVARFAEATSVESPIEASSLNRPPFTPYSPFQPFTPSSAIGTHYQAQAQPADVGFGYISSQTGQKEGEGVEMPFTPRTPLKSAMKTAGAAPRTHGDNPLSPTFKEEQFLEKREKHTEKEQKRDLRTKIRVRVAKMVLRSTNFACSLIVLGMISTTFRIFIETKAIPPRNNLPPWAVGTNPWAQIVLLVISCISLSFSLLIFYGYWTGGHQRAERAAVWYTVFSIGFFTFSIVMWGIGAGLLHSSKANGNGQDIWGWSCKDNTRMQLFQSEVSYSLVCRLQNWSLVCCLIVVVVETITILIYGITFHRFYTKHRLHKSMHLRDKARSELYLAQIRSGTLNTPATAPYSARDGFYNPQFSARDTMKADAAVNVYSAAEEGSSGTVRYLPVEPKTSRPFTLQAPPTKSTPKNVQVKVFETSSSQSSLSQGASSDDSSPNPTRPSNNRNAPRVPSAMSKTPEEQDYGAVPIPSAYNVASPSYMGTREDEIYGEVPVPGVYESGRSQAAQPHYGVVPLPAAYDR